MNSYFFEGEHGVMRLSEAEDMEQAEQQASNCIKRACRYQDRHVVTGDIVCRNGDGEIEIEKGIVVEVGRDGGNLNKQEMIHRELVNLELRFNIALSKAEWDIVQLCHSDISGWSFRAVRKAVTLHLYYMGGPRPWSCHLVTQLRKREVCSIGYGVTPVEAIAYAYIG